ncbi:MAG TPA: flagellar biosynthesis anti-sigma factor FlgM [Planctomycetota bacterium]|nr:flagellar biosynthesis anti-sigma factor FlgM [Planctomycetota bacterium]
MEIRNDKASGVGSNRIDLTKANREAIREQNPSPPEPQTVQDAASNDAKRVAAARDRFEAQSEVNKHVLKRVHDARAQFSVEKRVREARAEYSVAKRVQLARKEFSAHAPEDKLTLSSGAKQLTDAVPSIQDASVRAQRVSELKELHQNGQLDVQSLVAEAAFRMLSAE